MGKVIQLSDYRYNILDTEDIPAIPGFGCHHEVTDQYVGPDGTVEICKLCGRRLMPPPDAA